MKTLSPPLLSQYSGIVACFTTRHGGISKHPYDSANLAFHVGDDASDVLSNHRLLAMALGYEYSRLVHMRQIHSDRIVIVNGLQDFNSPPECDALITDRPGVPIMVMSADCTPILLYDPDTRAIGAVHAGRAGALQEILPKTIETMVKTYGTKPENLRITLGPSIGGCCYEINPSIAATVEERSYANALRSENDKIFLDVNTILLTQLERMDIKDGHVEVLQNCTACESDEYFSYRADQQRTGRIAGVIMLR